MQIRSIFNWSTLTQKTAVWSWVALRRQIAKMIDPVWAFGNTRLIICVAALIGYFMLPTDPGHWEPSSGSGLLGLITRWDSRWYDWIVQEGYWLRPGQQSNIAFFPLYPLIIKVTMPLVGNNTILAGVLISNLAFLLALIVLYQLVESIYADRGVARRTVYYLAIFPTSFFFSAMYSESLFLLFTVTAVYFARKKLWVWATLMGLLASATRTVGVLIWGLVMWEWLQVHGWTIETIRQRRSWHNLWNGLRSDWFHFLIISVIPLGLLSYMLFLQMTFNDPIAFSTVQAAWGRENVGPWTVIIRDVGDLLTEGASPENLSRLLNLGTLIFFLAMSPLVWRRLGAGYAIYIILSLLIPATSASQSIIRYALVCFPLFIVVGDWGRNELFDRTWVTVSAVLLGVLTAVFVNWFFVA